jgi:murein L,D-transpeptidase YafK
VDLIAGETSFFGTLDLRPDPQSHVTRTVLSDIRDGTSSIRYPNPVIRKFIGVGCVLVAAVFGAARAQAQQADRIVITKSARQLTLLRNGKAIRTYRVCLGSHPVGPKEREGDGKTPEGIYRIDRRNGSSKYHLALHVSYPNAADQARARSKHVSPGGEIMIHGVPNRWRWLSFAFQHIDWTAGCIAVKDNEIEEIWRLVPNGTVVEIRP